MKTKITKQKRNLINELSFWIIKEIDFINNNDTTLNKQKKIKTLINIIKSAIEYDNKQIKNLINDLIARNTSYLHITTLINY